MVNTRRIILPNTKVFRFFYLLMKCLTNSTEDIHGKPPSQIIPSHFQTTTIDPYTHPMSHQRPCKVPTGGIRFQ